MLTLELKDLTVAARQHWLQHAIAPRPIAFASTIDKNGHVNLSPFSFFNLFSSNPPIVVFSPARRVRDNSTKHTLENLYELPEVAISICDYDMVQQVSLASCEFAKGVDEFVKAGFTKTNGKYIQPPLVKEAKVNLECAVTEIKPLGTAGGAGNLVIAEVLCMHVADEILNENKDMIDQRKLQHVARLGGNWYCRVNETNLFEVPKPNTKLGIGIDALPKSILNSRVLTGNNLGMLANADEIPGVDATFEDTRLKNIFQYYALTPEEMEHELHLYARELLESGNVAAAWQVLLSGSME
ncbi:flavin reductase family protein [Panacibacter sp. DH6]|uniref:Flavin reductase family protein n=1 Tax=Panacibacter microcysteis TaxID=2793269 RepID=A0A931E678_9BACT|nr:flavin reductase family protein [Panacibacter microcysteis]MBG9375904.1 flavin reductase family protein [Panacibacter microcysteis]